MRARVMCVRIHMNKHDVYVSISTTVQEQYILNPNNPIYHQLLTKF